MGDQAAEEVTIVEGKSRGVAIMLALFLGGIGAHKFYLGRPWRGFFYLIFCWTLIPAVIGFLEGLMFLFTSDQSFQKKYVKTYRVSK